MYAHYLIDFIYIICVLSCFSVKEMFSEESSSDIYPMEESNVFQTVTNSTHFNETLDVIETSCKIVTEKLVSTAKASVTSSLSHICKTGLITSMHY